MASHLPSGCLVKLSQTVNDRGSRPFQTIVLYTEDREKAWRQTAVTVGRLGWGRLRALHSIPNEVSRNHEDCFSILERRLGQDLAGERSSTLCPRKGRHSNCPSFLSEAQRGGSPETADPVEKHVSYMASGPCPAEATATLYCDVCYPHFTGTP